MSLFKVNKRFNREETDSNHYYYANGSGRMGDTQYNGFLKCKLVHGKGYSIVVPDFVFIEADRLGYIQPLMFTPNNFIKLSDDVVGQLFCDISCGLTIKIWVTEKGFVRHLRDGSELYRCVVFGVPDLPEYVTGEASLSGDGVPSVLLHHHTKPEFSSSINESSEIHGSQWNIAGTRKLENTHPLYLTCLDNIATEGDLQQIAMASNGRLLFKRDNFNQPKSLFPDWETQFQDDILVLQVYRGSTYDRTAHLAFMVESDILMSQPVLKHNWLNEPIYYQICSPFTHRISLNPNASLTIKGNKLEYDMTKCKHFDYIIVGDATTVAGLAAPYNEEDTEQVLKIERCDKSNILRYWFDHANSDQFTGKNPEKVVVKDA